MIIYKVTCLENNKIYIGKTVSKLTKRKTQHLSDAKNRNDNYALHNAIRKYGKDSFVWEIIDRCLFSESLIVLEKHYIKLFNCVAPYGYNLTEGGEGNCGYRYSDESKIKMSISAKNRKDGKEHLKRLWALRRGRKISSKHKARISECNMGHAVSAETRIKISQKNTGRKKSEETKEKMRRHKFSEEHKKNLSISHLGKKPSTYTRDKMSIASKAAWVSRHMEVIQ